jgi:hypothetical protein
MSKVAMSIVTGAGAVLMAYMAYKAFAGKSGKAAIQPTNPGGGYTSVAPGEYLSTDQLIYGAATGSVYDTYATTDDLINGVIYGTAPGKSIIKVGDW